MRYIKVWILLERVTSGGRYLLHIRMFFCFVLILLCEIKVFMLWFLWLDEVLWSNLIFIERRVMVVLVICRLWICRS